jgi:hypothetical protein
MANYEARAKELSERYKIMQPSMKPEDDGVVLLALKNHAQAREDALNALYETLADKQDNPLASRIAERIDAAATRVLAPLNTMLDGIKDPSANLRAFRDIAAAEEARFFDTLKKSGVASNRDEQMTRCHKLEVYAAELRAKWTSLSDTEKALLERERYAAAQLRDTVKRAFEEAVPAWATGSRDVLDKAGTIEKVKKQINDKVKEEVRKVADKLGADKRLADELSRQLGVGSTIAGYVYDALSAAYNPLGSAIKTVGKAAKALEPIAQAVVDQKSAEIRQLLGGAQNVVVTFSTTRREATDYVRNNGYEQAKSIYDNSRRALEDWMNGPLSDGMKVEARRLFDAQDAVLQTFVELMRQAHTKFVSDYRGIFFESVSQSTIDMMSDKPFLEEWADGINRLDMDQQLQQMYAGITDLHGNLDRAFGSMTLFADLPLEAQAMLQEQVRRIEREVRDPITAEMREHTRTLEQANAKKPATVVQAVARTAKDLAEKAARGGG